MSSVTSDHTDDGDQGRVSYQFPVEIEVIGELGDEHARQFAHHVFERLDQTLRSRG
jgi:hypothetical protein